jgi:hypothetical protein
MAGVTDTPAIFVVPDPYRPVEPTPVHVVEFHFPVFPPESRAAGEGILPHASETTDR